MDPLLTKYVREPNSFTLDFYLQHEGYDGLQQGARAEARSRSSIWSRRPACAAAAAPDFPTGMKWQFVDKKSPNPKYIACNADESEPGTFKDHLLMERNPHLLIEGCAIGCYAIGAKIAYIYIRGEFLHVQHVLERGDCRGLRARDFSAGTCSGPVSTATSTCTAAPAPTRPAKRPRCSNRSRASGRSRATSRRFRPSSVCTTARPRSTTSRPSPTCR